jgi:hypothetical protein
MLKAPLTPDEITARFRQGIVESIELRPPARKQEATPRR